MHVVCTVQVCPAGWKPGEATMVADPEKSLEYFATVEDPKVSCVRGCVCVCVCVPLPPPSECLCVCIRVHALKRVLQHSKHD